MKAKCELSQEAAVTPGMHLLKTKSKSFFQISFWLLRVEIFTFLSYILKLSPAPLKFF